MNIQQAQEGWEKEWDRLSLNCHNADLLNGTSVKFFIRALLAKEKEKWEAAQKIKDKEEYNIHAKCEEQWKEATEIEGAERAKTERERIIGIAEEMKKTERSKADHRIDTVIESYHEKVAYNYALSDLITRIKEL